MTVIQPEILPPIVRESARQQALDNVNSFRQTLVTLAHTWPSRTDNVFV